MGAPDSCKVLALLSLLVLSACGSAEPSPAVPSVIVAAQSLPTATAIPPTMTVIPPTTTAVPPTVTAALPTATAVPPTATAIPPTAEPSPTSEALVYAFPIQGAQVEYGRFHHDYPATDIFCPIGSLFVAPTSGVIDFVSREDLWNPATNRPEHRGGLAVAMIGDDGVRYYGSHLSEVAPGIEPGVRVVAGQELGKTGASGNAASTPPHLHFGISRPTTSDDWRVRRGEVPPYSYLQAWTRGEAVTPELP